MLQCTTGLILAALSAAPTVPAVNDAIVMHCDFGPADDVNFDGWPDRWQRQLDASHPVFAEIAIDADSSADTTNRCLRISAAGKTAAIFGPKIDVDASFSYVLEGSLKTTGMKHSHVCASITFTDENGRRLATHHSPELSPAHDWQPFDYRADPPASATHVRIGLHVDSLDETELTGAAWFDNLRLVRLPRLQIESARPHNLFAEGEAFEFACHATGDDGGDAVIVLELSDVDGRTISVDEVRVESGRQSIWRPSVTGAGFYRVRATLSRSVGRPVHEEFTFAVLHDTQVLPSSRFGWTLSRADLKMPSSTLADMLSHAQVGWVKLPMSFVRDREQATSYVEAFRRRGIQIVAVLENPRGDWRTSLGEQLEGLPFSVRWAQLPDAIDSGDREVARFLAEHTAGIRVLPATSPVITIRANRDGELAQRAGDLVRQMLGAKLTGDQPVFLAKPFSEERGVIGRNGQPSELFMPWHTTARVLSGAEHLGAVGLPGGGKNHVFRHVGQVVMIAWSDDPRTETIQLGEHLRQLDVWGRESQLQSTRDGHTLELGPLPVFVTGLDEQIVHWNLGCRLQPNRLASVVQQPQTMTLRAVNPLDENLEANVSLHAPHVWSSPVRASLALVAHGEGTMSFAVSPHALLPSGRHDVRIEFDVNGTHPRRFVVYRTIDVGLDDFSLDVDTRWDESGNLIVTQQLLNSGSQPASFGCLLFAPGQRRQRVQILDAKPGTHETTYIVPNGEQFLGKTLWLEIHEINGPRMLNHRIEVRR